jgi:hypothetical protein
MILASLKPYYYYLIGERKKTIEVRKTALKNLPQDIAFYMSKDEKSFAKIPKEFQEKYRKHFGKIGMRVICDEVDKWKYLPDCYSEDKDEKMYYISSADGAAACLTYDEIENYGESKTLYGWHISDLKIYDKPRELSEFRISCNRKNLCYSCNRFTGKPWDICNSTITRPPQSYMRVKELKEV